MDDQLLKFDGLGRIGGTACDDLDKVFGEHERHALSLDAVLLLEVAQKVTEIDMKQLFNNNHNNKQEHRTNSFFC